MNKKLNVLLSFTTFSVLAWLPVIVLAINFGEPGGNLSIEKAVTGIIDFIWPIFGGVAILMLIFSGFLFLTAAGDPGRISTAKKAFIWAVIGIVVGVGAYSAVNIIASIVGG